MAEGETPEFVGGPVNDDWKCPVCLELVKDPFLTECCGHHFCNRCINTIPQNACPLCRSYPCKGIIDKRFQREVNEAQVYCLLRPQGCEWTGRFGHLNTHLNKGEISGQCKYVSVKCPNNNCYMALPRRDIKRHVNNECQYRAFACPHCGHKGVFKFVELQHYPKCQNYPVACPYNCTKNKIKQSQLQKHFSVCPNAIVSCAFSEVGCKIKVKRCNLKRHSDSYFTQHQTLISTAIAELQKDNKTIKKDCQLKSQETSTQLGSTQTRLSTLEKKCSILEYEFHNITEEVRRRNKQFTEELEQTQNCVQILFSNYTEVQEALTLTCEENERLKYSVDSLHSTCYALETEVGELKSQLSTTNELLAVKNVETKEALSAFMAETKKMLKDEVTNKMACLQQEVSTISQKHLQVDYWIDGYKLMAERMKKVNWELYLRTMAETATQFPDPICPVILNVNGYEQGKRKRDTLVSSSFYIKTTKGEYKFVLVINFTPDSMVVSASLTRGKHDNSLDWPFTGTIFVTLLNLMEDKNHYSKEIWSAADNPGFKYAGRPLDHMRNPSWSRQDFISLKELESSITPRCFIMNDLLYFEVNNSTRKDNASSNCCIS